MLSLHPALHDTVDCKTSPNIGSSKYSVLSTTYSATANDGRTEHGVPSTVHPTYPRFK